MSERGDEEGRGVCLGTSTFDDRDTESGKTKVSLTLDTDENQPCLI